MLVFWRENLVLLSVPKTGTSALEAALRDRADVVLDNPPEVKHVPLFRYNRFLKPLFGVIDGTRRLETMALVREPEDWLGSWYRYRARPELAGHPNSTAALSFDAFVEGYLSDPRPGFAHVGSPRKFLSNGQGKLAVKHLFQYEQMPRALAFLSRRLEVDLTIAPRNVSPRRDVTLDPALRDRLRRDCAAEFDLWRRARRDEAP
ncbi:MAG: gamma-glutamyl kinase [Pseudomonadota bacterium]